jgi:fermentation-respiration switch protein FrsA (DUF1100 family)
VRVSLRTSLIAAAVLVTSVTIVPQASAQDFYTPPNPLPQGGDGEIVKTLPSRYANATSTRIMYLTRDAKNRPIAVTGTVLVPNAAWPGGPRPIVAYAPFTAGMGDRCAPSKALAGDGGDIAGTVQGAFVDALLAKGFAVAQTDYQGLGTPGEHTYVVREAEAHAVLDVLRAAQRLPGLPRNGPLGIAGYSEGGGASASAVELAPTYAPELDIRGAYAGAPPADKAVLAKSLDGGLYFGFLGYALIGINEAYPESGMLNLANPTGAQLFLEARDTCTGDAILRYALRNSAQLTKDGRPVSAYMEQEPFRSIVAANRIGTLRPTAPTLVEHAGNDDVIPHATGKQMAKDWCAKGANVQFRDLLVLSPGFAHAVGALLAPANAANWLADRFAGRPASGNCGRF